MKRWFFDMQKEIYALGPLLSAGYGTENQNTEEGDIGAFLRKSLARHGKRSVFFVRFFPLSSV
jgi:hypothetical protein